MEEKRKELDDILREITAGLTGDPEHDAAYLIRQMEGYKEHELSGEIIRACGRLLYDVMPDETRDKVDQAIAKDHLGTEAALDEVRFNMYKGDFEKALKIIEDLVRKIEALDAYRNDLESEYYSFDEIFELVLYAYRNEPKRNIRWPDINYAEIYLLYGTILVELRRFEEAKSALQKAMRWNPVSRRIYFEYAEIFKMTGDMEEFHRLTLDAFRIAFHSPEVARCYRNLGFYFVEKEQYDAASACYRMSTVFAPDSRQAMSELYFISTKTNREAVDPSPEEMERYSDEYGIPLSADEDIIGLSYAHGKQLYDSEEYDRAAYFWSITYELTDNPEIRKLLDGIEQRMN